MKIATMITKNSITVNFDSTTRTVLSTDPSYEKVLLAIKEGRHEDIPALMDKPKHIEASSGGTFRVVNGVLTVDRKEIHGQLGRQIQDFMSEG